MDKKIDTRGNVLLVDDEIQLAEELKWQLESRSYKVNTASGGAEALKILKEIEIDVLLVDINMPGMDGIELIQAALKIVPDLQCIIITGHADLETAVDGMRLGAINFLCKPKEVVANVLDAAIEEGMKKLKLIRTVREEKERLKEANKELTKLRNELENQLENRTEELREAKLRELIVVLMNLSLQYYEFTTNKSKIDLAEESGIWILTEDQNSFVPKTMNRYLMIDTVPRRRPNFKAIQKTAYFVLSQEQTHKYPKLEKQLAKKLNEFETLLVSPT